MVQERLEVVRHCQRSQVLPHQSIRDYFLSLISQHLKHCLEMATTDNLTLYPQEFGSPLWLSLSELWLQLVQRHSFEKDQRSEVSTDRDQACQPQFGEAGHHQFTAHADENGFNYLLEIHFHSELVRIPLYYRTSMNEKKQTLPVRWSTLSRH